MKNASSFPHVALMLFVGVFLLLPNTSLAATLSGQGIRDTASTYPQQMYARQFFRQEGITADFTGTVRSIILYPNEAVACDYSQGFSTIGGIAFYNVDQSTSDTFSVLTGDHLPDGGCLFYNATGIAVTAGDEIWFGVGAENNDPNDRPWKFFYGSATDVVDGTSAVRGVFGGGPTPDTNVADFAYVFCDTEDCSSVAPNTSTHIETVDPEDEQVIATSSLPYLFETTGYVNENDYKDGSRLRIKIDRNTDQQAVGALLAFDAAFGNYTYLPIATSGDFALSTTSLNNTFGVDRVGYYRMTQDIQIPEFGIHFWFINFDLTYQSYDITQTSFTVGTTTALDNIQLSQEELLTDLYNGLGDPLAACQFSFFDSVMDFSLGGQLVTCLGGLAQWAFVPNMDFVNQQLGLLKAGFLSRFPWGYFTRFVDIMTPGAADAVMPPIIQYTFGTASDEQVQGLDVEIDMWSPMDDVLPYAVADDGSEKNIWDIVNPYFSLVVGFCVILVALSDLVGIELARDRTQASSTNNGNSLTRREKRTIDRSYSKPQDIGESRRAAIARRGDRHDRMGGRGIIH